MDDRTLLEAYDKMVAEPLITTESFNTYRLRCARAFYNAISASGEWAVVPVEPTVDMIVNAENAQSARYFAKQDGKTVPHKEHEVVIWDAMLQARPKV